MRRRQEATVSPWNISGHLLKSSSLQKDETADVCVVGAGIAGLSTACFLAREGRKVVLLESRGPGGGQTSRTTAHLMTAHDDRYSQLEVMHGTEGSRAAAESHVAAIDLIDRLVHENGDACDFERIPGYLCCALGDSPDILEKELAASHRAGLRDVTMVPRAPLSSFNTGPSLLFPSQGQIHPLKYTHLLTLLFLQAGGRLYHGTQVKDITAEAKPVVSTEGGPTVVADAVVVATNSPIHNLSAIHSKQAPYLTYASGFRIKRGQVPRILLWDSGCPYHYVRLHSISEDEDLLIVGGEDHKCGRVTDQTNRHHRIEQWAKSRFPFLKYAEVRWSGIVMETIDGVAFIGPDLGGQPGVYIVSGDSGMGMTHGTIAGLLLTDLIQGRSNPWASLYSPSRQPLSILSTREFVIENLEVDRHHAPEWIAGPEILSPISLRKDEGAVVRNGVSLEAIYRDDCGKLHRHSAICPHRGCVVHWNSLEKVWDCPCHGSRFDAFGEVISGPAKSALSLAEKQKSLGLEGRGASVAPGMF